MFHPNPYVTLDTPTLLCTPDITLYTHTWHSVLLYFPLTPPWLDTPTLLCTHYITLRPCITLYTHILVFYSHPVPCTTLSILYLKFHHTLLRSVWLDELGHGNPKWRNFGDGGKVCYIFFQSRSNERYRMAYREWRHNYSARQWFLSLLLSFPLVWKRTLPASFNFNAESMKRASYNLWVDCFIFNCRL